MKRLPLLPTLIVAAAVLTMIALGIWQLQRAAQKEALLAAVAASRGGPLLDLDAAEPASLPVLARVRLTCSLSGALQVRAGQSAAGASGYRYLLTCTRTHSAPDLRLRTVQIDAGWARSPRVALVASGTRTFTGMLWSRGDGPPVLTAETPLPPLRASRPPSAVDIPNNHLMYAGQWFFFASIAALIYVLALRRRLPGRHQEPTSRAT